MIHISIDELKALMETCISTQLSKTTSSEKTSQEFLTPTEAAAFLRVSKVTLHKWKVAGIVSFIQEGTTVRYEKQSLVDALNIKSRATKRRKGF